MRFLLLLLVCVVGCAVPHSSFVYTDPSGASLKVNLYMKEVEAENLNVEVDYKNGTAKLTADKWETQSVDLLKAQAKREELGSKIAEKATAAGVSAAVKSIIPVP